MRHSVAGGTATLLLARLAPPAASFGVFYLALLHWEPDTWGLFHLLLSAQAILQMAAGLGIDLLVLHKGLAESAELPRFLRAVCSVLWRVGAVLGIGMILCVTVVTDDPEALLTAAFLGGVLPAASLTPTLEAWWVSVGRVHRLPAIVVLEHGSRLLVSLLVLTLEGGPALVALVVLASKWLGTALLLWPLTSLPRTTERLSFGSLLRQASPYALFFVFSALLGRMDSLALALFRPIGDVGYFGAASRVVLFCTIASQAFGLALYPHLVASRERTERYHQIVRASLVGLSAASFVPTGWLHAFPEITLRWLHVDAYLPAGTLLGTLALALPAWFTSEVMFRSLLAEERLAVALRVVRAQIVMGVPAFAGGAFLHGAHGVATATVWIAWLGAIGYLSTHRHGAVLTGYWITVLAIGGAMMVGIRAGGTGPIWAFVILLAYASVILGWMILGGRGSVSPLELLTRPPGRRDAREEKGDNPD